MLISRPKINIIHSAVRIIVCEMIRLDKPLNAQNVRLSDYYGADSCHFPGKLSRQMNARARLFATSSVGEAPKAGGRSLSSDEGALKLLFLVLNFAETEWKRSPREGITAIARPAPLFEDQFRFV